MDRTGQVGKLLGGKTESICRVKNENIEVEMRK